MSERPAAPVPDVAHQTIVAVVHGPVDDRLPEVAGLIAASVLRPHPEQPSPHPGSVGGVVIARLAPAARPDPAAWSPAPVDAYRVDARVQIDGPTAAAIVQCSFVRRLPPLTRDEFAAHWNDVHAPLVPVHHPGVARYVQHVVIEPLTPGAPEVDGIAQLYFGTLDDFRDRYYDSEAGRELVGADVARFIDRPRGWRIHAQETEIPV